MKDEKVKKEDDEDDVPEVESKLPIKSQRLIELIFNQNHFNSVLEGIGYNADKLPLGKLSKATLKQGFDHLNELASLIKHPNLAANKYQVSQAEVSLSSLILGVPSIFFDGCVLLVQDSHPMKLPCCSTDTLPLPLFFCE